MGFCITLLRNGTFCLHLDLGLTVQRKFFLHTALVLELYLLWAHIINLSTIAIGMLIF